MPGPCLAVLLKRVDLRPTADPLTGAVTHDPHGGLSTSDRAALELALALAAAEQLPVRAVSAGGPDSDAVLRMALAAGATEAMRVDLDPDAQSLDVARALVPWVRDARFILCGDYSLDRGTGSVPAYVAGLLAWSQVLGASAVAWAPGSLQVTRRLDRGRREVVRVAAPAVLSVDGGLPPLRRAPLPRVLAAQATTIAVVAGAGAAAETGRTLPLRPRARVLPGPDPTLPTRERLLSLSGALQVFDPPRVVVAPPAAAADELLAFLVERGYLAAPATVAPPP